MVAGGDAARARHVLDDDRRVAGDVRGEMLGEDAAVEIVAAAGAGADQDRDGLALVEIGDALLRRGRARDHGCSQSSENKRARNQRHGLPPHNG